MFLGLWLQFELHGEELSTGDSLIGIFTTVNIISVPNTARYGKWKAADLQQWNYTLNDLGWYVIHEVNEL